MEKKTIKNTILKIFLLILSLAVIVMLASFIWRIAAPPIDPLIDQSTKPITASETIQVNILNACGEKGIANQIRNYLRAKGFDVVEIGNYDKIIEKSKIFDRVGDISSAKKVAYILCINDSLVFTKIDSSLFLRASIIVGKDYKTLKPFN